MKKIIAMLICAVLSIGIATAQNSKTYTGFVVDKNGNPVVGAEVMAPGGGVSAITDSDGSFTIEVPILLKKLTASYAGMREKTIKLGKSSNLVFNMKTQKNRTGFISLICNGGLFKAKYGQSINYRYEDYDFSEASLGGGIMGGQIGQLGNWGWYGKGIVYAAIYEGIPAVTITAGAIRKLGSEAHLYFGVGWAYGGEKDYRFDSMEQWDSSDASMGYSCDLGTIFTVSNHVNVIVGLNYAHIFPNFHYSDVHGRCNLFNLNIGVGYTF